MKFSIETKNLPFTGVFPVKAGFSRRICITNKKLASKYYANIVPRIDRIAGLYKSSQITDHPG